MLGDGRQHELRPELEPVRHVGDSPGNCSGVVLVDLVHYTFGRVLYAAVIGRIAKLKR